MARRWIPRFVAVVVIATTVWWWRQRRTDTPTLHVEPIVDVESAGAPAWRAPVDGACPDGYPVKVAKSGIFHEPGGRSYDRTVPDRCYAAAAAAEADGYRRAKA